MNEIVYTVFHMNQLVESGEYEGYKFAIFNYGLNPSAYVGIPDGHPLRGNRTLIYSLINCHGGITLMENLRGEISRKNVPHLVEVFGNQFVIGWDYAHYGDFLPALALCRAGKVWTTEEIFDEIKDVIIQLKNIWRNSNEEK